MSEKDETSLNIIRGMFTPVVEQMYNIKFLRIMERGANTAKSTTI